MQMSQEILSYIEAHREEAIQLLVTLAKIPAPSNHEEKRAAFCKQWLERQGAEGVYIDEALNVVYPVGCTDDNPVMVFMAHTDVVFPDTEELPLTVENGRIYCPGVGDDTANVVALLMAAKYIAEKKLTPRDCGVLLVCNSGEEGLGNLKGSRRIMEDFGCRVQEFVTFDCNPSGITHVAVGSHRYRIEIDTEGGHSYGKFGNRNAIAYLASLIDTLYTMKVPEKGKTTYNVGTISGGTSVNTIAQHAEMLYEYRSDNRDSLEIMRRHLEAALDFYRAKGIQVKCTMLGDRPCGAEVDLEKHMALKERARAATKRYFDIEPEYTASSTDCNIPLSMGIPAICPGCIISAGTHTRGEYAEIDSLQPGICLAYDLILYHF